MRRFALIALAVAAGAIGLWRWWQPGPAGHFTQIAEFGANPTALQMHLYVPQQLKSRPAVLLALHWCQGSGPAFHASTRFSQLADAHGFLVIYPSVTRASHCWDVHSPASLTHGGGSDPAGLLSMLEYVIERHGADRGRIFVAGHSSGGMMTQALLGTYPDVFSGGASSAGVPFGCFAGPEEWNTPCARGEVSRSAAEWGNLVRDAHSGFTGNRPALQLWHGTADDALSFHNFGESIKQWTDVLGTAATPASTLTDVPSRSWTQLRFTDASGTVRLEAYRQDGGPHNIRMDEREVIRFFGLDRPPAD
jgi:acetylxylan esterase